MLRCFSGGLCASCWTPPDYWDGDDIALEMSEVPNIWTDGSREDFSSIGCFEVAGAGVFLPASELAFEVSVWRTAEEYGDARLERCRAFMPVPGVMQTVQRAEFWGAILAMQAYWPCHLGHDCLVEPLPLVKDGDSVAIVQYMIRTRGRETVRGMLRMLMFSKIRFGWWINRRMLRLILLLT